MYVMHATYVLYSYCWLAKFVPYSVLPNGNITIHKGKEITDVIFD